MACETVRFIISNWLQEATLSASPEPVLSAEHLKNAWRSRVMRYDQLQEPLVLEGILPHPRLMSGLALVGQSLSATATLRLELFAVDIREAPPSQLPVGREWQAGIDPFDPAGAWPPVVYDSGLLYPTTIIPQGTFIWGADPWGLATDDGIDPVFAHWFPQVHARSFRLTLHDPHHPHGYFDVRQLFIGDTLQLDRNFSYGFTIQWQNARQLRRTEGGSLLTVGHRQQWRELVLPLEQMTERDREVLARQQRQHPGEALFVSAFPAGREHEQKEFAMACQFHSPVFTKRHYQHWQTTLTLQET